MIKFPCVQWHKFFALQTGKLNALGMQLNQLTKFCKAVCLADRPNLKMNAF